GRGAKGAKPGRGGAGGWPAPQAGPGGEVKPLAGVATPLKPGLLFVLKDGKPVPVRVRTGISDGTMTEVQSDQLQEGTLVVVGVDFSTGAKGSQTLAPPPGMGGPTFRGPRPSGRR
ncbi:MAG TPA: hypothetical protein VGU27_04840, partial [Candidatus Eisenbacteria bacterium]|nr:hypothetical protein [Candidatus Eisenbacteria bacterium]